MKKNTKLNKKEAGIGPFKKLIITHLPFHVCLLQVGPDEPFRLWADADQELGDQGHVGVDL